MNERVMQFRIGMFVIFAGLVLAMLIVWFGESPSLFREHAYIIARYDEAPGVAEGIAVRKSGIRVGEVTGVAFDDRPNQPDGVLVTISLDTKYKFKAGTVPKLGRSLIGDVTIDLMPGAGPGLLRTSKTAHNAPVIEGLAAPDPAKALEAATKTFEKAGATLASIENAAGGFAKMAKNIDGIEGFIATWTSAGKRLDTAAEGIDRVVRANEGELGPAVADFRQVVTKLNTTLDPPTLDSLKTAMRHLALASSLLNSGLANASPFLKDIGAPVTSVPQTDFGSAVRRINLISADLHLLTRNLRSPDGQLNTDGSLQKLITTTELHDNLNKFVASGMATIDTMKPIVANFRAFAEKIARDPSSLAKGALAR
jgi:phospholipid/cholesterol/gamma-HCH transport system substrate-binding protein